MTRSTSSVAFWSALAACAAVLCAAVPAPALAQPAEPRVAIMEPGPFDPVFGQVEVVLEIASRDPVTRVEIFVDDVRVGVLTAPPWKLTVDVGQDNAPHTFRAVASTDLGATGTMRLETPAIQVDDVVELPLRQLYVTVEQAGQRVLGLEADDFVVRDDGDRQTLVTFEGGDAPMNAVILVDSSESMRGPRLAAALEGARQFTEGLHELDEAKVMLFSDRLNRATPFTGSPEVLDAALAGVEAGGGTALTDHVYAALKLLDGHSGRPVVVVLSDGSDIHSVLGMEDVLWKVRRSQAIVYWIELQGEELDGAAYTFHASSWRTARENAEEIERLRSVVAESGGRVFGIRSIDDVGDAFAGILRELREQYVLGYYPTNLQADGDWRKIRVRTTGGIARVRDGYVDY
jgi:Ca-activated chloride channel family protein